MKKYRNQFIRTLDCKVYQDGKFFNLTKGKLEETPMLSESLNEKELIVKAFWENEF